MISYSTLLLLKRLPIGLLSLQKNAAIIWLIMTGLGVEEAFGCVDTGCAGLRSSLLLKSRPIRTGIPIVSKYRGPVSRTWQLKLSSAVGSIPATDTFVVDEFPLNIVNPVTVAERAPASVSSPANNCLVRSIRCSIL